MSLLPLALVVIATFRVVLSGKEVVLLKSKAALLEEKAALSQAPIVFLDIREKLQLLCDKVCHPIETWPKYRIDF